MSESSSIFAVKIIIEILCFAIVALPSLYYHDTAEPFKRGFFCNDESIMYPYKEMSQVPTSFLHSAGILVPVIAVLIGEAFRARNVNGQGRRIFSCVIPHYVSMIYDQLSLFLFGALVTVTLTDLGKITIGRLRPHFLALCAPDIDCSHPNNTHRYITEFECKNASNFPPQSIRQSRLSFPSGHSSFAFYSMVYLALYLHSRVSCRGHPLIKYFLQFLCLLAAWFTAMSRISDYRHHWSDVLVGMALGTTIALVTAFCAAGFHRDDQTRKLDSRNEVMECTGC